MRPAVLWSAALLVSAATLAWSGTRCGAALSQARQARAALARVSAQAQELQGLRATRAVEPASSAADLPPRISSVLAACGLPPATLAGFSAEASRHDVRGQQAALVLHPLTLPEAGRFLARWREAEPAWVVAHVELAPRGPAPPAGGDLPLQALLTLEAHGGAR